MTTSSRNDADVLAAVAEGLAQMFQIARATCDSIESNLWMVAIKEVGAEQFLSYVRGWVAGDLRHRDHPPRVSDFRRYCDPTYLDADMAFEDLSRLVAEVGPYRSLTGVDPRLLLAVERLGGWVSVCEKLPSVEQSFDHKRFRDAFLSAWTSAQAAHVQASARGLRLSPPAATGLIEASKQRSAELDCALPAPGGGA